LLLITFLLVNTVNGFPDLSDNYQTDFEIISKLGNETDTATGANYIDFVNRRERQNWNNSFGDILNLFNEKLIYRFDSSHCSRSVDNRIMPEPWFWVPNSKYLGTCPGIFINKNGTLWSYTPDRETEHAVCVASDNKTPYWTEYKKADYISLFYFKTYTPQITNPNIFTPPSYCPSVRPVKNVRTITEK